MCLAAVQLPGQQRTRGSVMASRVRGPRNQLTKAPRLFVAVQDLQLSALVPAWLKVCCPNVTSLKVEDCAVAPHLQSQPWSPAAPPAAPAPPSGTAPQPRRSGPAPLTCQHLQSVTFAHKGGAGSRSLLFRWGITWERQAAAHAQWQQHVREQLAALPSLASLATREDEWMLGPALVSTSLTSLSFGGGDDSRRAPHLAVQFPNLRQLRAEDLTVDDDEMEALLLLPRLERLSVGGFNLQRSHVHRAWTVRHLEAGGVDVDSLARLPLEGVQTFSVHYGRVSVVASGDAQAVARVAEAVRRWGGAATVPHPRGCVEVERGASMAAVLTTLGPLLAALPAAQRRGVALREVEGIAPVTLQALGQQLPASVASLRLLDCALQPEAWPALLPSLPATVAELQLSLRRPPTEEQLVAVCEGAVRRVRVACSRLPPDVVKRVNKRLAGMGKEHLVVVSAW